MNMRKKEVVRQHTEFGTRGVPIFLGTPWQVMAWRAEWRRQRGAVERWLQYRRAVRAGIRRGMSPRLAVLQATGHATWGIHRTRAIAAVRALAAAIVAPPAPPAPPAPRHSFVRVWRPDVMADGERTIRVEGQGAVPAGAHLVEHFLGGEWTAWFPVPPGGFRDHDSMVLALLGAERRDVLELRYDEEGSVQVIAPGLGWEWAIEGP